MFVEILYKFRLPFALKTALNGCYYRRLFRYFYFIESSLKQIGERYIYASFSVRFSLIIAGQVNFHKKH